MTDTLHDIVEMLASERGIGRECIAAASRLRSDLGMDGDDAVVFFAQVERRFGTDLSLLYANWNKHFALEASLLEWAVAGSSSILGGVVAALAKAPPLWAPAVILVSTFAGSWCYRRLRTKAEITVHEVVTAVSRGAWHG